MPQNFVVTAPKGLIDLLRQELQSLGLKSSSQGPAALYFEGELADAYKVCLWSRVANRVLMPMESAKIDGPETLYDFVRSIDWRQHLTADDTLAVDCTTNGTALPHSQYAALKVKDAICDQFLERDGVRPSVDTETPSIRINLHERSNKARLSLDLSGSSLHRRGYRSQAGEAPIKENLAAGILMLSGWPDLAKQGRPLHDPMCGSATLLIEGALIASDTAPGLLRDYFGFLDWAGHDKEAWQNLIADALQRQAAGQQNMPPITGGDSNAHVLRDAEANIRRAGFAEHIEVSRKNIRSEPSPELGSYGLLASNPPYGERMGSAEDLHGLYGAIGDYYGKLSEWQAAIFTAAPEAAAYFGYPASDSQTLYNGRIECRLLHYTQAGLGEEAQMLVNRLQKNLRHVSRWAKREQIFSFRLYDRDLPEFAFAIDIYDAEQIYGRDTQRWVHVQEYQATKNVDQQRAEQRRLSVVGAVAQVLDIPSDRVVLKQRIRQRGKQQYQRQTQSKQRLAVQEGPATMLVNLRDYLDTGLFLDHRPVRAMIREMAKGKRFLNLYCYTATVTVQAALGGAIGSTSVDMSATYLDWAGENFRRNNLDLKQHRLARNECQEWLDTMVKTSDRFDLIFMDPPTFSNSKRMSDVLDIQRDHVELIQKAAKLLAKGGQLIFSTNARKFKLDNQGLKNLDIEDISAKTIPEDFKRNQRIHQCWIMQFPPRND